MNNSSAAEWLNRPNVFKVTDRTVEITTEPGTDLWQRTYYGFRIGNAPALLFESRENFTFSTKVTFAYRAKYDQCGLLVYVDDENWFKVSIEYENEDFSRLGSVVTSHGYSDWATTDIPAPAEIWYRLSRRGPDFLAEYSSDGASYRQMRVFHLHPLGETTAEMGRLDPPAAPTSAVRFGPYACSPSVSSFTARFEQIHREACRWTAHAPD